MKVNFVLPHYGNSISGGLKVIFEYANYLAKNGDEVIIYHYIDRTLDNLPRYIPLFLKKMYGRAKVQIHPKWFALEKSIRKVATFDMSNIDDADAIIATAIRTAEPVLLLPKTKGEKFYFIQDYENWDYPDEYVRQTYAFGLHNITVAEWLSQIVDSVSIKESTCIKNGIDSRIFFNKNQKRKKHSISFHYRKEGYKGCEIAYQVIDRLREKYEDLSVYVVCSANEMPKHANCINYTQITPQEVASINNQVEVFLCTSRKEGFGLPGLESMACGAVLVSTDYLGVHEYAIDYNKNSEKGNALLAPIDDVEMLVQNVIKVFENRNVKEEIAKNAQMTVQDFTISKSAQKFEECIKNSLNGGGTNG